MKNAKKDNKKIKLSYLLLLFMRFRYLFLLILLSGAANFSPAYSQTGVVDTTTLKVKIGPPELGALISPEEAFKISLDNKFKKKEAEEAALHQYMERLRLQALLNNTEVISQPETASLNNLSQLLLSFEEQKDVHGQMLVLNTYAVYYAKSADLPKSVQFFKQSLQLQERDNNKTEIARLTETLAALSKITGNYEDAIFYNEYNSRINSSLGKANQVAEDYLKIAQIKALKKEYTSAEYYILRKAFPLFRRMGNKVGRMNCFENLGKLYSLQEELSKSKWFYLQANIMAVKLNDIPTRISSLIKVAQIKNTEGDSVMALADYKEAEQLAKENNQLAQLVEIKGNVGEIYRKSGDYLAANTALDEYNRLKENLLKN